MAVPKTYRGFSTIGAARTRSWVVTDIDLVKLDLQNAFQTRIGERILRPDYGCLIWDLIEEPMDDININKVSDEARRICSLDPRLALIAANTFSLPNGVRVEATLNYIGFNIIDQFTQIFERQQNILDGFSLSI